MSPSPYDLSAIRRGAPSVKRSCKCGHPIAVHSPDAGCMALVGSADPYNCDCELRGCKDWDKGLRDRLWASQGVTAPVPTEPTPCPGCTRKAGLLSRAKEVIKSVEWSGWAPSDDGIVAMCPLCDQVNRKGHSPDCLIGMLLAELEGK
jgi:hypothetical protein